MLRLCQQIRCHDVWIRVAVGNDQHFARSCHKVDTHLAVALAFCFCHKAVSRSHDEIYRLDLIRSIRKGCDSLCSSYSVYLVNTGDIHSDQCLRVDVLRAFYDRGAGCNALYTCCLCRDPQHERRGIERISASRNIAAAGIHRDDPVSQHDAFCRRKVFQFHHGFSLCLCKGLDVGSSFFDIFDVLFRHFLIGCLDFFF